MKFKIYESKKAFEKILSKKTLLPVLLGICIQASGQIYNAGAMLPAYQDVNPDTLLNYVYFPYTSETFGVNLFDDAMNDVQFEAHGAASSGGSAAFVNVTVLNTNVYVRFGRWDSVYITGSSAWNVTKIAQPLNAGDPINTPGAVWDNTMLYLTDHSGQMGGNKDVNDWIGGDKYIGIKYVNGNIVTYGWIRVQCATKDTCFVKDLSYVPATLAVNEYEKNDLSVFPNPGKDVFYLKDPGTLDISSLRLVDLCGQEVKFSCTRKGDCLKIDLDRNLAGGCFFLQYRYNDQLFSQKLIQTTE